MTDKTDMTDIERLGTTIDRVAECTQCGQNVQLIVATFGGETLCRPCANSAIEFGKKHVSEAWEDTDTERCTCGHSIADHSTGECKGEGCDCGHGRG